MEQDPLASAAPVLQSGPGALDIGYKRMGIEADAAKLAAFKEAALNKLKEAQKKRAATAFKIDAEVPFFTHKAAFAQDWKAEEDWLAQKMMDYDQGKGDDPMDPTSKAGIERQFRAQQLKMKTGYSKQMGDMYVKATDYIDKNYNNLKPGTKEKLDAWISDIDNLTKGETYDPIIGNIDLNKVVQGQLKELATSTTGAAWVDPITGESHSFQTDQIIAPQVLAGIQGVLSDHYNREQAEFDAAEIAIADPVRYKRIVELAAKNNIPVADALIFDYAAPVYTMKQHTETVGQASEAGAGRKDYDEGLNWLAEWRKGAEEGKYEGNSMADIFGVSIKGGESLPDAYKTLKGWVFGKSEVYDSRAKKNVKKETTIDAISLDRNKDKWIIKLDTGEVREIPTDKFESEVIPRLGAYNKEKIAGIGGYLNSAKKSGYFKDIKGSGAEEMVKTNNKKSGALDLNENGELD